MIQVRRNPEEGGSGFSGTNKMYANSCIWLGLTSDTPAPPFELVRMRELSFDTSLLPGQNISCVIHEESILLSSAED